MSVKVSVILPVYNVSEYLRQCMDSIVGQTLKDIEIICVDDGSTDDSLEILKELLPILEETDDYSVQGLHDTVFEYIKKKEIKNGQALWPLRTAVSGKQMTPAGAFEIMEVIGKEESLERIKKGIELLSE